MGSSRSLKEGIPPQSHQNLYILFKKTVPLPRDGPPSTKYAYSMTECTTGTGSGLSDTIVYAPISRSAISWFCSLLL